ncbi:AAA family ATPase [Variovorax guangxiensis]|uniref:ATPase AAA-type core domain-containing protein n=1 Tax=Variovorax guangxiensis TaxID=1775474 RepID=A0A502E0L6_9BURK|nr:ATP-binding protein [Variovorax guangxiensis]TPG26527.1 hypothetical protein EAH83_01780 [Variovorax ginsengisoli]TPG30252.1 hypothetical protein EAH82_01780 [Variovorax guangxiensis]
MRLKKVRLFNGYKRFQDLTIDLGDSPKKIVVLVGGNGSGKSSVFDGLMMKLTSHIAIGNKGTKNYRYHSMNGDPTLQHDSVKLDFVEGTWEEVWSQKASRGTHGTIFSLRSPYRYNNSLNVTSSFAVPDIELNQYGASSLSDLDDKMEENYRRLFSKYNQYMNANDSKPSDAKRHIIGQLNNSITKCLALSISSLGNIEDGKGSLYFVKPDHQREFPFDVLSSGEKEVVDILLDLYLRADKYDDTVFLIDEPELHINSAIQRKLLHEIVELIGPKCQLWIATHSIGFLRAIQEGHANETQVIHFEDGLSLANTAATLHPSAMTATKWREVFSVALDDLSHLVSPERIVYCEGRDAPGPNGRERGLDAIVFNIIFSSTHPNTLFVSSGGNTELDQRSQIAISILSKALPSLKVLVLKDRDMISGGKSVAKDRADYLTLNKENHRVLIRFEIENYLFDKEILQNYCQANDLSFDEPAYDALITNIVDDHVKDEYAKIKNICGIKMSISADRFKELLARHILPETQAYKELLSCIF